MTLNSRDGHLVVQSCPFHQTGAFVHRPMARDCAGRVVQWMPWGLAEPTAEARMFSSR
jgi:hypothetical protein